MLNAGNHCLTSLTQSGQRAGRQLTSFQIDRGLAQLATLIALPLIAFFTMLEPQGRATIVTAAATGAPDPGERHADNSAERANDLLAGEYVMGAYTGTAYSQSSEVRVQRGDDQSMTLKGVEWDGLPFRNPIYYGVRVSAWGKGIPFGVMLDFTHAKAIAQREQDVEVKRNKDGQTSTIREKIDQIFKKLEFSHGHNILLLNGLLRLPFGSERLSPYLGAGAGLAVPHVEIDERDVEGRTYGYQFVGPALQALMGVELRLAHTSVFLEYKLSFSPYQSKLKDVGAGSLETDLITHHLIGGFSLRASRTPNINR